MADNDDEIWRAALEDYAARMTPDDFRAFTARVRVPDADDPLAPQDPAARAQQQHWRDKTTQLLGVPRDENGAKIPLDVGQLHLPQPTDAMPEQQPGMTPNRAQSRSGGEPPPETERDRNARLINEIRDRNR